MPTEIGRLITAMVTPFDDDGQVDYEQAKRLALALLDSGTDGLVVTGEARVRYESGAEATWAFGFEGPRTLGLCISASGAGGDAEADLTTGRVRRRPAGGEWTSEVIDCTRPEAGFIGMRESLGAFIAAARGQGRTSSGPDVIRRTQPILLRLGELEAGIGG